MRLGGSVPRVRPRGYQPGFVGEHDGLDAVAEAELGQDPANVDLHRALGQEQAGRDLAVGQASRDAGEDVLLAVGEGLADLSAAVSGALPLEFKVWYSQCGETHCQARYHRTRLARA